MTAHFQGHELGSTADHLPGTNDTVPATVGGAVVEQSFSETAAGSTLALRQANGNLTVPSTPATDTDATSKLYVDSKVVTGVTWKELVLVPEQLIDDPNGGLSQGILMAIAVNLQAADTIVLSDGTTTETFTAVGAAPAAFQFQVGGSPAATLTNLVAAINADSTLWSAVETDGLDPYFAGSDEPQAVIYRTQVPTAAADDRLYGTIANSQADVRVVAFNGITQDYRESSGTESDLPAADPVVKTFGLNRPSTGVQTGDTHRSANDNNAFTWDGDDAIWQNTDTGTTVTAGDGIQSVGGTVATKNVTPAGAATQEYGAIVNNRTSDGTGLAAADQGYNAVRTDNAKIAVSQSLNALTLIGMLGSFRANFGTWTSDNAADRSPSLAELQTYLGTTAADINNIGILIESGGPGGRTGTFIAFKKANAGVIDDYQLVELTS